MISFGRYVRDAIMKEGITWGMNGALVISLFLIPHSGVICPIDNEQTKVFLSLYLEHSFKNKIKFIRLRIPGKFNLS